MPRSIAVTTIRAGEQPPGQSYPFLPDGWGWELRGTPLELTAPLDEGTLPTLRLVKDNKVVDLFVPGMGTAAFLAHWGLRLDMASGGYVLSKRLSRLLQPYRYWRFCTPRELRVAHVPTRDGRLWDGCGRVSRLWLMNHLLPTLDTLPEAVRCRAVEELLTTERWEITLLHAGGEEKGDVLVVEEALMPNGAAFAFPAGSAKPEVRMVGRCFVGLAQARHAKEGMRLDPQSLINLHPFLEPAQLLAWLEMESGLFLESLATGRMGRLMSRLACDKARLARLAEWHVGEYLASGGDVRWFAGITRELGRQHLRRLIDQVEGKVRFPAPGGRLYLFPAAVGGLEVARGEVRLDLARATAWVNSEEWVETVVPVLGGCDGDDAVWVLPFTDHDGSRRVLLWRSPNQLGEYLLLAPDAESDEIRWALAGGETLAWPPLDSRRLPPRVDEVPYEYATLPAPPATAGTLRRYSVAAMDETIRLAVANRRVLGSFCNLMMVTKALYGRLPLRLPATLETIIDGSVKRFVDLTPVRAWVTASAAAIARQGTPVPACLVGRLAPLLPRGAPRPRRSHGHWLDALMAGVRAHQATYAEALDALAREAMPPAELFLAIPAEAQAAGRALRARYAATLRGGGHAGAGAALLRALPGAVARERAKRDPARRRGLLLWRGGGRVRRRRLAARAEARRRGPRAGDRAGLPRGATRDGADRRARLDRRGCRPLLGGKAGHAAPGGRRDAQRRLVQPAEAAARLRAGADARRASR